VNVAQRLEESCDPGRVNISASTLHHVTGMFEIEGRGAVSVKHLGAVDMYFLSRIRPEYASDPAGQLPNKAFWQAAGR
jgi:class 3 adenylate cyclase